MLTFMYVNKVPALRTSLWGLGKGGVSNVNKAPALRTSLWGLGKCEQCKQGPSFKDISMGPCEGWGVQCKQGPSFKDISVGPWEV